MRIKALTVCQPHAWAIAAGYKPIENRPMFTTYRGPILIHAGKNRGWWAEGCRALWKCGIEAPGHLRWGELEGIAEVVDCVPVHQVRGRPFAWGPWCWIIERPQRFDEGVPIRGRQGLFNVEIETLPAATAAIITQHIEGCRP